MFPTCSQNTPKQAFFVPKLFPRCHRVGNIVIHTGNLFPTQSIGFQVLGLLGTSTLSTIPNATRYNSIDCNDLGTKNKKRQSVSTYLSAIIKIPCNKIVYLHQGKRPNKPRHTMTIDQLSRHVATAQRALGSTSPAIIAILDNNIRREDREWPGINTILGHIAAILPEDPEIAGDLQAPESSQQA